MQPQKESRATTSCTECQRRKQKVPLHSRLTLRLTPWTNGKISAPENGLAIIARPGKCLISVNSLLNDHSKSRRQSRLENSSSEPKTLKRSAPDSAEPQFISQNGEHEEIEDGLKVWGYMPGHVHYKIGNADEHAPRKESPPEAPIFDAVDKVLHAIPPRSITDAFVNHFLSVVNYRYSAIYGPTLAEQYVQWWTDRGAGKQLSPEFTCLLLRICAYSVQYLTPSLRKMIEFELACSSQTLTERFSDAAEELSRSFEASRTSIERVQELFLKGAWLKSESKIVESWHALSRTIREAQELGIDKDAGAEDLCEFGLEIRRRIWTLLYIWDWQMSAWLGRPNLIDQKNLTFKLPNLRLDQSTTQPNLLSPFAHMALQATLGRRIAAAMGNATSQTDLSAEQVLAIESTCEKFIEELPPIFRIDNPDLSLDEEHPYFVFQRHQLHCVIFLSKLDFLKPYLTRERRDKITDRDDEFRRKGIDVALDLLKVARKLFDHEFPINAKFHMVVFCVFDTATLLCSAIIHDRDRVLPHREEVVDAIENSLDMLHQLSLTTKLGASSYNFLFKLPSNSFIEPAASASEPLPAMTMQDDLNFDIDQFLAQNPFGHLGDLNALDMGGMEQIWDWEDLHLDVYTQAGPNGWGAPGESA
ncbi:Fungal-trans domain containing protein [Pyrenophora tritici-repentis]|nr:Fungal-trans domain containing protein [Pyrenophora tritici-repentis]KAI1567313.1 Fungal-trans domain containing protein [Pyrenophora tritici-repentis]